MERAHPVTRILFIGDIMGRVGRRVTSTGMNLLGAPKSYDLVVANAENSAGGFGITERIGAQLLAEPIDVLTGGNHTFDKREALSYLKVESRVLRPANYPPGVPGHGVWTGKARNGARIGVVNLMGRVFMHGVDDPFRAADEILEDLRSQVDLVIIDFHAEATSEKVAFGWHVDGRVAAVVGTHTHVQTSDARVLPGGTAYITDVGMTGPLDSVIGVRKEDALSRFITGIPSRFQVARGDPVFCAVSLELDEGTGLASRIAPHWDRIDLHNNEEDEAEE
jgi:metallophosphoesterase (TIGR00282 family)